MADEKLTRLLGAAREWSAAAEDLARSQDLSIAGIQKDVTKNALDISKLSSDADNYRRVDIWIKGIEVFAAVVSLIVAVVVGYAATRLPGSYRSEIGTWQDRVSHVPSHISCVAGRDRSTRGRTAETHATRARLNHNGPVRQRLGLGQAQGQSAHCATPLAKACQSRGLHSINKGNCVPVPLIGQFRTVVTSPQ